MKAPFLWPPPPPPAGSLEAVEAQIRTGGLPPGWQAICQEWRVEDKNPTRVLRRMSRFNSPADMDLDPPPILRE